MNSFFKLLKRFFTIFGSKLNRTLDELDTIKDRSRRIKEEYLAAQTRLTKTREDIEGKHELYIQKVKTAESEVAQLEAALVRASSLGHTDRVEEINSEIEAAEQNLDVFRETRDMFAEQVDELDSEAKQLSEDIRQAGNTLDLAEARYQAAKDLIAINSDGIPDNLRAQIEKVRQDADEMSARYKGVKRVKAKAKPTKEKILKEYAPTRLSAEERLKSIQSRNPQ